MMINAYPQNNMYGNAWWGVLPPYGNTGTGGVPYTQATQQTVTANVPATDEQFHTIDQVVWGQGENGAKAFMGKPGQTVMILDSESDRFWIKQFDAYGRPSPLKCYRYTEDETATEHTGADYVTRKEFDDLKAAFDALRSPESNETNGGE